jgi:hypothetical protein
VVEHLLVKPHYHQHGLSSITSHEVHQHHIFLGSVLKNCS